MTGRAVVSLLAAAVLLHAAAAYECPVTCDVSDTCMAASTVAPGGLANGDVPQFIVLTNDDAITVITQPIILNITERHQNKNGCKMPATWFVSTQNTDPVRAKETYQRGHEIATHTITHVAYPNVTEIVGARDWLNKTAGIPLEDLQGFRAPFLEFDAEQRRLLANNSFRYDSSISEKWSAKYEAPRATNAGSRMWPYTFDCGIAQDCSVSTGSCDDSERWPGLWEFPLYSSQDDQGTVIGTMDPQGNLTEIFIREFDNRYNGNRAPVGIFIHAAWLIANPAAADQINQFLDYAATKEDVFFVTISQVLDWMKNPVPADQYDPGCRATLTGMTCVPPSVGCGPYGTFNADSCVCDCQNENVNIPGFCKDEQGSCTVQKAHNDDTREFFCPTAGPQPTYTPEGGSAPSGSAPSTDAPAGSGMTAGGDANCGHPLVRFMGMSSTGNSDPSLAYVQNLKAVDGDCNSCAFVPAVDNTATFELNLESVTKLKGVQLLSTSDNNTYTIRVGKDGSNNFMNNPICAQNVAVPANTATTVPCEAEGSYLIVSSSVSNVSAGNMTLCDVYPIAAESVPAPAAPSTGSGGSAPAPSTVATPAVAIPPKEGQSPVTVEFDITGMTPEQFMSNYASTVCTSMAQMTGEKDATCYIVSATPATTGGRRLMQSSSSATTHVVLVVNTSNPDVVAKAFSNGTMLANLIKPTGVNIVPTTVEASATAPPPTSSTTQAPAPTDSGSDSGGSNTGAIVGAVVGSVCGVALVAGVTYYIIKRRKAAAATGRMPSVSNPTYDATATVTFESPSKRVKGESLPVSESPLRDAARSLSTRQ